MNIHYFTHGTNHYNANKFIILNQIRQLGLVCGHRQIYFGNEMLTLMDTVVLYRFRLLHFDCGFLAKIQLPLKQKYNWHIAVLHHLTIWFVCNMSWLYVIPLIDAIWAIELVFLRHTYAIWLSEIWKQRYCTAVLYHHTFFDLSEKCHYCIPTHFTYRCN